MILLVMTNVSKETDVLSPTDWAIVIVLLIIAGLAKGLMDRVAFHNSTLPSWMQESNFWGSESWRNKWKNGNKEDGEAFLGSSTFFVFITDGWHLMQFIFLNSLVASIAMLTKGKRWLKFIIFRALIGLGFKITYK